MNSPYFIGLILILINLWVLSSNTLKRHSVVFYTTAIAIFIRYLIVIINSDNYITPGSELDANSFHKNATYNYNNGFLYFGIGATFYEYYLTILYMLSYPSRFIGCQLSVLFFTLSTVGYCKISHLIHGKVHTITYVIFLFLPSSILFTSITLRESAQLFGVIFMTFGLILGFLKIKTYSKFYIPYVFGIFTALLHHALFVFVISAITKPLIQRGKLTTKLTIFLLLTVIVTYLVYYPPDALNRLLTRGIIMSIAEFQSGFSLKDRATYKELIPTETNLDYFLLIPRSIFYYIFMPLPTYISGFKDIYGFIEVLIRVYLISYIIIRRKITLNTASKKFIWFTYWIMTTLWAIGTVNYGTGARHHLLDVWCLYLLYSRFEYKSKIQ